MNIKTSIVLALLFVALAAGVLWDKTKYQPKLEEQADNTTRIAWLDGRKVQSIQITKPQEPIVTLSCKQVEGCALVDQSKWKMTAPSDDIADAKNVSTLLNVIRDVYIVERVNFKQGSTEEELEQYGLNDPRATVSINLVGETNPLLIKIGTDAPIGSAVYVWSSSYPGYVFLIGSRLRDLTQKDASYWREKRILPELDPDKIKKFTVAFAGQDTYTIEKVVGGWQFTEPVSVKAHVGAVFTTLRTLKAVKAATIIEADVGSASVKTGKLVGKIKVVDQDDKAATLSFYAIPANQKNKTTKNQLQVQSSQRSWVGLVYETEIADIRRDKKALRMRRILTSTEQLRAKQVVLRLEDGVVRFEQKNQTWSVVLADETSPTAGSGSGSDASAKDLTRIDSTKIPKLLQLLASEDFDDFVANDGWRKQRWQKDRNLVVSLIDQDKVEYKTLHFYIHEKAAYVDGEVEGELRVFDAFLAKKFPTKMEDLFKSKTIAIDNSVNAPADKNEQKNEISQ